MGMAKGLTLKTWRNRALQSDQYFRASAIAHQAQQFSIVHLELLTQIEDDVGLVMAREDQLATSGGGDDCGQWGRGGCLG